MRRLALAASLLLVAGFAYAETLHIKIVLADAGQTTPVPGHALLISDNPATSAPRLIRTRVDGTADVQLRPGNYTVESDKPVTFHGRAYQWTQIIDVRAGRDASLELTVTNAEVGTAAAEPAPSKDSRPLEADPAFLMPRWQESVVTLWTPTKRATAFVIDARGLLATNAKAIGNATSVEVQLTPAVKVAGRVLVADDKRDVAVLWIDPQSIAGVKPVPLGCAPASPAPPAAAAQPSAPTEIFAIGISTTQVKDMTSGTMSHLELPRGSEGGPIFTADGTFVAIASSEREGSTERGNRIVTQADACAVVASAGTKMANAMPPPGTHLPIEPDGQLPEKALKEAASHRAGSLNPYQVTTPGFEVSFITPVMIAGARGGRLFEFGNWSDYVGDLRPVLYVRVSPKMVQSFWMAVARGAALTQGAALPAITHPKSGLSRLRAYCGDSEVTPIHPFTVELRVADKEIAEPLFVFDPGAFAQCASVKFVLFSEKEPARAETALVSPDVVKRIQDDFAPNR